MWNENGQKNESRTIIIIHGIFRTCWSPSLPIAGAVAAATDDNHKNDFYEIRFTLYFFDMLLDVRVATVPIAF